MFGDEAESIIPGAPASSKLIFVLNTLTPAFWLVAKIMVGLYVFIWIRATLPRLRYDMLMAFGWKGLLPIAIANLLCVAIAMAAGSYLVGAIAWVIGAAITLIVVASLRTTRRFTAKTRRKATVRLYSSAQPFVVVREPKRSVVDNQLSDGAEPVPTELKV